MEGMPAEGNGETRFASATVDQLLATPGLRAQLPPCPLWPDLN